MSLLQGQRHGVTLIVFLGGWTDTESKAQRGQNRHPGSHGVRRESEVRIGAWVIRACNFLFLICFQPRLCGLGCQVGTGDGVERGEGDSFESLLTGWPGPSRLLFLPDCMQLQFLVSSLVSGLSFQKTGVRGHRPTTPGCVTSSRFLNFSETNPFSWGAERTGLWKELVRPGCRWSSDGLMMWYFWVVIWVSVLPEW